MIRRCDARELASHAAPALHAKDLNHSGMTHQIGNRKETFMTYFRRLAIWLIVCSLALTTACHRKGADGVHSYDEAEGVHDLDMSGNGDSGG